ncbi:MAG: hypothetical protein GWO20_17495 [Candidatus Korarchaeota archaeon]|nr:hypothetical protein [Candidatus Korarchaeota archaeon]NIU85053.1 hypothetical protein [Candidatus Thorarchaeota archaeon]NIW15193.1 hypothetical protein [Candidatus Thorarchaeota archaeon]NIW53105.1 hypothetical protein [Candidatus Korarchaeota archaeon]
MGWRGGERKRLVFESEMVITLKWRGEEYFVLGDADKAVELYRGEIDPSEILLANEVFLDIQKGEKASHEVLREMVIKKRAKERGKASPDQRRQIRENVERIEINSIKKEAASYIAEQGYIKLPKKVRERLTSEKREKLLRFVEKYAVNPATKHPYPPKKVEEVFEDMSTKIKIDPLEEAQKQIPRVVDALSKRLPLKLEILTVQLTIPAQYSGKAYSELKKLGEITNTQWKNDGSLEAEIKIPGGQFVRLKRTLNDLSRGQVRSEIVGRESF